MAFDPLRFDKKISVIIPLYNGEKYLRQAIQSAVEQTLQAAEIIVVDDGSSDRSALIVAELAEKYPLLQYFRQENAGQAAARNFGVRQAQGELIAFLDQDDIWYPNHLAELSTPFLEKYYPEIGWVYGTVDDINEAGELHRQDVLSYYNSRHPKRSLAQCLADEMFVIPSATLVSKKAFLDVGGFDERLSGYEDDDLFVRMFVKGYNNIYVNESVAQWRIHQKSCSWDPRMAASRLLYAKKLLAAFEDDYIRNIKYRTEVVLPRFIEVMFAEIKRAVLFHNYDYAKYMRNDLKALYSYMTKYGQYKCNIMLMIIMNFPFKSLLNSLTRIYWRFADSQQMRRSC